MSAFATAFGSVPPLLLTIAVMVLDLLIGDPDWLVCAPFNPHRLFAGAAAWAEARLNRPNRSALNRRVRGALFIFALIGLAIGIGELISRVSPKVPYVWVVELLILLFAVSQREPVRRVRSVASRLAQGDLAGARSSLAPFAQRRLSGLDAAALRRTAIETAAHRVCVTAVAPLFWYSLFGTAGVLASVGARAAASVLAFGSRRLADYGWATERMDAILNFIPARVAGLLVVAATLFTPGSRMGESLKTMARDAHKNRRQSAGWPQAALAGALDLCLGGPCVYAQEAVDAAWLGNGRTRPNRADMHRVAILLSVAMLLNALIVCLMVLFRLSA